GDADSDVQIWRDDLAGLTDLHVVRHEAGVDGGARCANRCAEFVGNGVQQLEVVAILHAAAAGDDNLGSGQFRTIALHDLFLHEAGNAGVLGKRNGFNGSAAAFGRNGVKAGGAHGDDLDRIGRLYGSDDVTGVDRTLEGIR